MGNDIAALKSNVNYNGETDEGASMAEKMAVDETRDRLIDQFREEWAEASNLHRRTLAASNKARRYIAKGQGPDTARLLGCMVGSGGTVKKHCLPPA